MGKNRAPKSWPLLVLTSLALQFLSCASQQKIVTRESGETRVAPGASPLNPAESSKRWAVILGPGGAKAWAHLGALENLTRQRWPIEVVAGLEMGALVAAHSVPGGQPFRAQWQLQKLAETLPDATAQNWQSSATRRVQALQSYLQSTASRMPQITGGFACPSQHRRTGQIRIGDTGATRILLQRCLGYPPHLELDPDWRSAAGALEELVRHLRSQGLTHFIYVDVLSQTALFPESVARQEELTFLLWSDLQSRLMFQSLSVDERVVIPTGSFGILQHSSYHRLVELGREVSRPAIEALVKKYGY